LGGFSFKEVANVEDKIAVRCENEKEWNEVQEKAFENGKYWWNGEAKDYDITEYGYTIISAQEYLSEGGKDVSEFKVGDRVECITSETYNQLKIGNIYTVSYIDEKYLGLKEHEAEDGEWPIEWFKLIGKKKKVKTQTTKENNMNINSSIRTVLVEENKETFETVEKFQKVFGAEIAENFTGAMILRKNIKAYNDEIKRLDDIEAERLEKEEKDK
jgi:hypothetical protein